MYPRMLKIGSFFFSPEEEVKRFHAVHFGCRNSITVITDLGKRKSENWLCRTKLDWFCWIGAIIQFVNQETRSNFPSDFLEIPWRRTACPSEISGKLKLLFSVLTFAWVLLFVFFFNRGRATVALACFRRSDTTPRCFSCSLFSALSPRSRLL